MDPVAVHVVRGQTVESVHRASVAVVDPKGRLVASFGNPRLVTFLRSSAKPFQLVPLIETGAADRFRFTAQELAIMAGSHSGEDDHVTTVEGILHKIGLGPDALQCGRHPPYNAAVAERVGPNFTTLHHNCSGKHSGMLALAVHNGWDPKTYLAPENPVQAAILKAVAEECGLRPEAVATGVDGCGVVNFAVPLRAGARAFARLTNPDGLRTRRRETLSRIRDAMLANPHFVSGTDRLDADFMTMLQGRVLVKAGAEACYGIGLPGRNQGLVIKVEDGNARAVGPILMRCLEDLGVANAAEKQGLARHWNDPVRNVAGRTVGHFDCVMGLRRARREAVAAT